MSEQEEPNEKTKRRSRSAARRNWTDCCRRRCRRCRGCPTGSRRCRRRRSTRCCPRARHGQALSAVRRCHDIGLLDPADLRRQGRERRVHLGQRSSARRRSRLPALADRIPRPQPGHRHAVVRRRPLPDQIPQSLDHRGAGRLLAAVHPSGQSLRSAFHHADRPRRLRPLSRRLDSFPGALARHEFQRRAAEGHAGRAMFSGQAGKLGRAHRGLHRRGDAAGARSHQRDFSRRSVYRRQFRA